MVGTTDLLDLQTDNNLKRSSSCFAITAVTPLMKTDTRTYINLLSLFPFHYAVWNNLLVKFNRQQESTECPKENHQNIGRH
jgi:hypothetical protein